MFGPASLYLGSQFSVLRYIYIALGLTNLLSAILLFRWNLLGFYLSILVWILASILNTIILHALGGLTSFLLGVLGILILFLVMKPQWKYFK
jgi:hypothetical protein